MTRATCLIVSGVGEPDAANSLSSSSPDFGLMSRLRLLASAIISPLRMVASKAWRKMRKRSSGNIRSDEQGGAEFRAQGDEIPHRLLLRIVDHVADLGYAGHIGEVEPGDDVDLLIAQPVGMQAHQGRIGDGVP